MKFEHFGIAVVELMSSGIITVAHNSAGPKSDIIGSSPKPVGYLGEDEQSYAFFVEKALLEYENEAHIKMREDARLWVKDQFGIEAFDKLFIKQIINLV